MAQAPSLINQGEGGGGGGTMTVSNHSKHHTCNFTLTDCTFHQIAVLIFCGINVSFQSFKKGNKMKVDSTILF